MCISRRFLRILCCIKISFEEMYSEERMVARPKFMVVYEWGDTQGLLSCVQRAV